MPFRKLAELGHPGHGAVVVHDFADHAGGIEPGDARQVDRRLGLARPHEHAAGSRPQGKHVPGARQVLRTRRGSIAASTVAARSPAEIPVLVAAFASIDTQNAVLKRAVF